MVGPDYQKPDMTLPNAWVSQAKQAESPIESVSEQYWWDSFHDPVLAQLINKASTSNLDLKTAASRISQARAVRSSAFAGLLPTGDLMASANRQQNQLGFPGSSGAPSSLANLVKQPFDMFKTGFDASWELDVFGGHKRELESAQADLEASAISAEDLLISTVAEVARNYIEIRLYQTQLQLAAATDAANQKTLELIQQRFAQGEVSGSEVHQFAAQQARDHLQVVDYTNSLAQVEYALDVLLAEQPGTTQQLLASAEPVPLSDKKLLLAAPASVIAKRPDLRNAERKLAAATAQQGVAMAKFFPDISLTGFMGLFNTSANHLLSLTSQSFGLGAGMLWPILNYASLSANMDNADAKQEEALLVFHKTLLTALSDVERSVTAYNEQVKHLSGQEAVVQADEQVYAIANERFQAGLTAYLEVLDAERGLNASRLQLNTAKAQTAQNWVAVYKSLGGSWALPAEAKQDELGVNQAIISRVSP
jgi:NodT family efflux transporter outer membrane factor (OMF) lipoprotein